MVPFRQCRHTRMSIPPLRRFSALQYKITPMSTPLFHRFPARVAHVRTIQEYNKHGDIIAQPNTNGILEVYPYGHSAEGIPNPKKVKGPSFFLPPFSHTTSSTNVPICKTTRPTQQTKEIDCINCSSTSKHVIGFKQDYAIPSSIRPDQRAYGQHYTVYPCVTMPYDCFNRIIHELTPLPCSNTATHGGIEMPVSTLPILANQSSNQSNTLVANLAEQFVKMIGEPEDEETYCLLEALCEYAQRPDVSPNDQKAVFCLCEILCLSSPSMREVTNYGQLSWIAYRSLLEYNCQLDSHKEQETHSRILQIFQDELEETVPDYWLLTGSIEGFDHSQYHSYIASTSPAEFVQALVNNHIGDHHTLEYNESHIEKKLICDLVRVVIPCANDPLHTNRSVTCNGQTIQFEEATRMSEFCPAVLPIGTQHRTIITLRKEETELSLCVENNWMEIHHRWIECQFPRCDIWSKDSGLCSIHRWA
jgi:hypothetical protein